jgi:hypothetical protein
MARQAWRNQEIWVCAACRQASCWAGIFYCDEYKTANIVKVRKGDIVKEKREHRCWLDREEVQAR